MTPNDIQVGKFYLHNDYPNSRWLGCGKRKAWTFDKQMEFSDKQLINLSCGDDGYGFGLAFKKPEDEMGPDMEVWEGFYVDPRQSL